MSDVLKAELRLVDSGVRFEARVPGREPVYVDYTPPTGGGRGYTSLELFLISIGSCLATVVKLQAARIEGATVDSVSAEMEGTRRSEHPTSFEEVRIRLTVTGENLEYRRLERMMRTAEERICPLYDLVRGNCRILSELKLQEPVRA